ncbi:TetR family transcriptional regulator [Streptomyces sp. CNQ-509]|uniref:TetR/AcrR family transcriptional regulator n=1 Tax=Streptomyces sp. CNQ-509 TaxID=444103 RepID=UPI00062DD1E9|nr:TetR/AcrR family transcriptional regulator [Streptomyces sp. CNQ-509]AKH83120.1 TetR family transcriptional regulator [Streptomyces sp. CNQ-509]
MDAMDAAGEGRRGEDKRDAGAVPASVEAAWGLRPRPQKGPKRGLTLDGIVAAAVAVADAEGLEAASMGRVAKELGVSTMALYRYVATKDELVTLMVDGAFGPPPPLPAEAEGDWRAGLRHWYQAVGKAMFAHPWAVAHVPSGGPPVTPNQLAALDQALYILRDTPLTEFEKVATALLVSNQVRAEVTIALAMGGSPDVERLMNEYSRFLLRVSDAGHLPHLRTAVEGGAFDEGDAEAPQNPSDYDEFAFGLERVLDGIEALINGRRRD